MRIIKEPEVRRNEILDAAGELFVLQGFDGTSTNEILEKAGIARGTLYYHFKSKEDIMDALIERQSVCMLSAARDIAIDKSLPVPERVIRVVLALNAGEQGGGQMLAHMHKPQNALMHQKVQKAVIGGVTPILANLIQEGIAQGLFHTPYPYECMEMVITYANTVFDEDDVVPLTQEERMSRIQAFLYNIERLLGVENQSLSPQMMRMFAGKGGSHA